MRTTTSRIISYSSVLIIVILGVILYASDVQREIVVTFFGDNVVLTGVGLVLLLIVATVCAPISALPVVPLASGILGPFLTGVLSSLGWTIGSVIAFLLARYAGRPFLASLLSSETLAWYEALIPKERTFITILLLRMLVPVDMLSYALGLMGSVSLFKYTVATAIGVSWFSFIFAYLGDALYKADTAGITFFGALTVAVLVIGWAVVRKMAART